MQTIFLNYTARRAYRERNIIQTDLSMFGSNIRTITRRNLMNYMETLVLSLHHLLIIRAFSLQFQQYVHLLDAVNLERDEMQKNSYVSQYVYMGCIHNTAEITESGRQDVYINSYLKLIDLPLIFLSHLCDIQSNVQLKINFLLNFNKI